MLESSPADAKVWAESGSLGTQGAAVSDGPGSHGALVCTTNDRLLYNQYTLTDIIVC